MDPADEECAPTPVDSALDQLRASFDHLLGVVEGGGLERCDNAGLVRFLEGFEWLRNRLPLIDHVAIGEGERRGLPEALCQGSMRQVLAAGLRISPGEAARRVRAAEAVGPRASMLGEALQPTRPVLAAAQRDGTITPEQVDIIARGLGSVDRRGFDPDDIAAGEKLLTDFAKRLGPKDLKHLTDTTVDAIDPDGTLPKEQLNKDRRFFRLRPGRDGSYSGEFRLTGALGAKLSALLSPLAKPRIDTEASAKGSTAFEIDDRSHGQRMHDALEDLCDRLLRAGGLPASGGTPTTVIVTITLEDLLDQLGYGATSDGTVLSAQEVLKLAGEADIIPVVLSRGGAVLDLGRSRRCASANQTYALMARDQGCSFPGCGARPEWCERHHIVPWVEGGSTSVDNLTLLCRYHHDNFASRGWTCEVNRDGLPVWTPPRWIDPERRSMINGRIVERHAVRHRRRVAASHALSFADLPDPRSLSPDRVPSQS